MAQSRFPLVVENLDVTTWTNESGDTYIRIGEHYEHHESGEWRMSPSRGFMVNITSPATHAVQRADGTTEHITNREAFVRFIRAMMGANGQPGMLPAILKQYPPREVTPAKVESVRRASWASQNGPVTTYNEKAGRKPAPKPAPDPLASELQDALS